MLNNLLLGSECLSFHGGRQAEAALTGGGGSVMEDL